MNKMSKGAITHDLNEVKYLRDQLLTARSEINNLRQQLNSLKHTHRKDCDDIKRKLEGWRCLECSNRQSASSLPQIHPNELTLKYIGVISTQFPEKRGTPRQPAVCSQSTAKLLLHNEVLTNPEHALEGLQEFSHMWILFHFHKNGLTHLKAKVAPPRLNGARTGVFATRSPHRPCPIGLSLVKIDRILEDTIYFSGVDMVDDTPVLDIKPYIPQYDNPNSDSNHFDESSDTTLPDSTITNTDSRFHISSLNSSSLDDPNIQELGYDFNQINVRVMDGEENGERAEAVVGAVNSPNTQYPSSYPNLEESFYSRSASRIGEREAPDGEEEESPRQTAAGTNHPAPITTPDRQVRVASWINQSPTSFFNVYFRELAIAQLNQLGNESEEKKQIIKNVLQQDPRSVYLRERWGNHSYVFRIAELFVSCKFDDARHTVTVFEIFQNSVEQDE